MDRTIEHLRRAWPLTVVAYLGLWTVPGLISGTQLMMSYSLQGDDPPWSLILQITLPSWYAWAILAPIIYLAAQRYPLARGRLAKSLAVHLVLNVVLLLVSVGLVVILRRLIGAGALRGATLELIGSVNTSLITYWTIVLVAHAVRYYEEGRSRALRAAELATQLSDARLAALKAQLHPHFLFNTMHAISAFLHEDPGKAETMLAELAELLRLSLESDGEQVVPLSKELDFVDRYLSLQKTRLGERLTLHMQVDPELSDAGVPSMILQPLLENAVEHGLGKRLGAGEVHVRVHRSNGHLHLEVADDGPGLASSELDPTQWRIGLRNTRERLAQLYGDRHAFVLENRAEGGLVVRVTIPYTKSGEGPA